MKILFITHFYSPHIGGVEKHTSEVARSLIKKGHSVTILTEKYNKNLKDEEIIDRVKVVRFSYPHIKLIGLKFIWWQIFVRLKLISDADIVHIHDVFIWYLPFKFIFPTKKVYTTFHGWEGIWLIPLANIVLKRMAAKLSNGSIAVGKYIQKYYGISANKIIYGGSSILYSNKVVKRNKRILFLGRLDKDTGVLDFLNWLNNQKNKELEVLFIGDGILREVCVKYGKVTGFTDPAPYLKTAEYVVPSGYLSYIEAISFGCKIMVFPNNALKKDYWQEIKEVKKFSTWDRIADEYLDLYNNSK